MPVEAVAPYLEFALPFYGTRDSAHDAAHIRRIVDRLDSLSEGVEPAPRPAMLHFLASFHGLGDRIAHDDEFDHRVRQLLTDLGWTGAAIEEAYLLLERHCVDPRTAEERVVHDANYIEVLGAFGIAKAFTKGRSGGAELRGNHCHLPRQSGACRVQDSAWAGSCRRGTVLRAGIP